MTAGAVYSAYHEKRERFDIENYAWARGDGPGTLTGRAYAVGVSRDWTCAGYEANLIPRGPGLREFTPSSRGISWLRPVTNYDIASIHRKATCDANGRFTFDRVPAGQYTLTVEVTTGVARPVGKATDYVYRVVSVRPGLTNVDLKVTCQAVRGRTYCRD
jgi:hypothetical protein